jgi:glycosyltransferase involved in cell wall biosynthesis
VHDLAFELFPGTYPALKALYLRLSTRHGARHAKRVIAVSRATANDLIDLYSVAPERISIIPNGVDERFKPQRHEDCEGFRSARGFGPYFLYLGTLQPRKNLTTLLKAWELTAARHAGYRLVIAGPPGWHNSELMKLSQRLNLSDSVTFLGWLPDEEIPLLLGAATALLFPSLYEGFGLPVLEAMACRTPVVVSDAPALKEVAEGAGLVVAARDTSAWAQAIDLMVQQPELRQTLAEAGLEKAGLYSWRRTAELTAKVYREVAHQ